MNSKNFAFDFTIPQGPTGPAGPAGTFEPLAFGGRYSDSANIINLRENVLEQVNIQDLAEANNLSYQATNSIVIEKSGIYELTYMVNVESSKNAQITIAVRENGSNIIETRNTKLLSPGHSTLFCANILYALQEGTVIDLVISSTIATEAIFNNNASLMIKQIM